MGKFFKFFKTNKKILGLIACGIATGASAALHLPSHVTRVICVTLAAATDSPCDVSHPVTQAK